MNPRTKIPRPKTTKNYSNRGRKQGNLNKTQQRQQAAPLVQQQCSYVAFASCEKIQEDISKKRPFYKKTNLPGIIPPTPYNTVVFLPFGFLTCKDFYVLL